MERRNQKVNASRGWKTDVAAKANAGSALPAGGRKKAQTYVGAALLGCGRFRASEPLRVAIAAIRGECRPLVWLRKDRAD